MKRALELLAAAALGAGAATGASIYASQPTTEYQGPASKQQMGCARACVGESSATRVCVYESPETTGYSYAVIK